MGQDIIDKFSTHLKSVLTNALAHATQTNRHQIEVRHLLWALGLQKGCIASEILKKSNVEEPQLATLIRKRKSVSRPLKNESVILELSSEAKRVVEKAVLIASQYGHHYVGTEHLLYGILEVNPEELHPFFQTHEINTQAMQRHVSVILKSLSRFPEFSDALPTEQETDEEHPGVMMLKARPVPQQQSTTPALDFFGRDLTAKHIQETIDPVIGREKEIERMMEILCRRTKNNPLLLGDPGVGKTAIVEGLAKHIAEGTVPAPLQDKRVISLDLAHVIAGTTYRGEFEGRLHQIIEEVQEDPDIILFIDEIHSMVGAGSASGSMDAASILKPALARGEIRCIGATTSQEYKQFIEKDGALERRFQNIWVKEPSVKKTKQILTGIAPYYESYHQIKITKEAIHQAVYLADRYVQDSRLPDKAIDLLDEALASVRIKLSHKEVDTHKRQLKRQLQEIRRKKHQAVLEERFEDAIMLKNQETDCSTQLSELVTDEQDTKPLASLSGRDIAHVVSRITGIEIESLLCEQKGLTHLERLMKRHIIGQDETTSLVARALRRAKSGVGDPNRPLASFLFLGPSGVGKTEMAKVISKEFFKDKKALIRFDMSEYSEGFTVSKLLGAPAGYVGYREQAKLTDQIKQRPHSIILFDEFEKAHKDVQNILLQMLEEGEIADATGKKISFKHSVIIITTNIGLERFENGSVGFYSHDDERQAHLHHDIRKELEERLRPELLNRLDHVCVFKPLTLDVMKKIAVKQLRELSRRLRGQKIHLSHDEDVAHLIASHADPNLGARDIRRQIQEQIEHKVAEKLLKSVQKNKKKTVQAKRIGDRIVISHK